MKERANTEGAPTYDSSSTVKPLYVSNAVSSHHLRWALDVQPWPEPIKGKLLLNELALLFRRFVVLPTWAPEVLALWTVHTYAFHLREATSYIGIQSRQTRCGKSKLLRVLGALVHRPVMACNIDPDTFLQIIEPARPTLLVDGADPLSRNGGQLRAIVESGCTRSTAFVLRVANDRDNPGILAGPCGYASNPFAAGASTSTGPTVCPPIFNPGLALFSTWCPKAVAMTAPWPDRIAQPGVMIHLERKRSRDRCERLRNLNPFANLLRHKCARFVLDHASAIAEGCSDLTLNLNKRVADCWEPLLVIADLAGDEWPRIARQAAVALTKTAPSDAV